MSGSVSASPKQDHSEHGQKGHDLQPENPLELFVNAVHLLPETREVQREVVDPGSDLVLDFLRPRDRSRLPPGAI